MRKVIYISGPMTGIEGFNHGRFNAAEAYLVTKGWTVLNPACLPSDMPDDRYMPICVAMLETADAVVMLRGWQNSQGASLEHLYAERQKKEIYYHLEDVPEEE